MCRLRSVLRACLVAAALWCGVLPAQGAALVSQTTGNEVADASGVTLSAGDLVVVLLRERDGSTMAVSDSVNGPYTRARAAPITIGVAEIWYKQNSSAGTANFTVTGGSQRDYVVAVFSGAATSGGADVTNGATSANGTSHTHGSITPSASAIIVTAFATSAGTGVMTVASGYTALTSGSSGGGAAEKQYYAYKLAHTGATNPDHVSANSTISDAAIAAFLESGGGGGGGTASRLTMIGVGR